MMLLRTLVLEQSGHGTPVNGALLCGFSVAQVASNFLAYSLDEEVEPGTSRVYIAALRRKSERYFLGSIDSKEDLQVAMHVFKQILTLAASSGVKSVGVSETQIPYHFIDLKGCKLPSARPEDHHSLTIKKALVMKVITLGVSVAGLPAIESTSLIVPSIRFSSQMVTPPKSPNHCEPSVPEVIEAAEVPPSVPEVPAPAEAVALTCAQAPVEAVVEQLPQPAPVELTPELDASLVSSRKEEPSSLFEVDNTLTSLARVAQELTQQKLGVLKQQDELELLRRQLLQEKADFEQLSQQQTQRNAEKEAALQLQYQTLGRREDLLVRGSEQQQAEQGRLSELARQLENQATELQADRLAVGNHGERLATALVQLSGFRDTLRGVLQSLDGTLAPLTAESGDGRQEST